MADTVVTIKRRPLHTCGVSFLVILHTVHAKTLVINGPIGSMARRTTKLLAFANPVIHTMLHHWLAILSFSDDCILAVERVIENRFPASANVFTKVDDIVQVVETLPGISEDAMSRFPLVLHQVPLLEWAVSHAINWLNFLIATLMAWGLRGGDEEKDIMVDMNCREDDGATSIDEASPTHLESIQTTDRDHGGVNLMDDESLTLPDSEEARGKDFELAKKRLYAEEKPNKGGQENAERKESTETATQVGENEEDGRGQNRSPTKITIDDKKTSKNADYEKTTSKNIFHERTDKSSNQRSRSKNTKEEKTSNSNIDENRRGMKMASSNEVHPILELFDMGWGSVRNRK